MASSPLCPILIPQSGRGLVEAFPKPLPCRGSPRRGPRLCSRPGALVGAPVPAAMRAGRDPEEEPLSTA